LNIEAQENMMPWEMDIFISLLTQQMQKEAQDRNIRQQMAKYS